MRLAYFYTRGAWRRSVPRLFYRRRIWSKCASHKHVSYSLFSSSASSNQGLGATILDNTKISIKNDATTRVSKLASREQIHLKKRDMRNIRNKKKEVERVPRLETGSEVPSVVKTRTGEGRERRADRKEESEVI